MNNQLITEADVMLPLLDQRWWDRQMIDQRIEDLSERDDLPVEDTEEIDE